MSTDPTPRGASSADATTVDTTAAGGTPPAGGAPGTDGAPVVAGAPEVSGPDEVAGAGGAQESRSAVTLGARDQDVLTFERQWWRYGGAKEEAIRERFGLSATRYYQVLNAVIDRPEALATDPLLVRRLRRMRSARQRQRSGRVLGSEGLRS